MGEKVREVAKIKEARPVAGCASFTLTQTFYLFNQTLTIIESNIDQIGNNNFFYIHGTNITVVFRVKRIPSLVK